MISQQKLPSERKVMSFFNEQDSKDCRIDEKWIEEEKREFSIYPSLSLQGNEIYLMKKCWIELACFVRDDLQWLLSLEHHVFWSHMIYSKNAHNLLISFLKESLPNYMRNSFMVDKDMIGIFTEIEHLVFLVFLRLSTEKESDKCFIENLGEILYNNYLFTVPILLDICVIYGGSNRKLVENMINRIVNMAPNFLMDFEEIVPQFFHVLNVVKEKYLTKHVPKIVEKRDLPPQTVSDLVVYLYDAVMTIRIFLDLFEKGCTLFCHNDLISEIIIFYSNVLPELNNEYKKSDNALNEPFVFNNLVENIRIDFLRIVKCIFDYVASEADKIQDKKDEVVDKYLNLMMELLSESAFLLDYNKLYSVRFEIESVTQKCLNVDIIKVNHILEGIALALKEENVKHGSDKCGKENLENCEDFETKVTGVKLNSLITEVQDILPYLTEDFIIECLKYYKYSTEKVISAVLENSVPPILGNFNSNIGRIPTTEQKKLENLSPSKWNAPQIEPLFECQGNKKCKYGSLREIIEDKTEINEMREWYKQFAVVEDEIYDDEYDDTYDENLLTKIDDIDDTYEDSDKDDQDEDESEQNVNRDLFLQNPAELREQRNQKRMNKKWVVIRDGGQNRHRTVNTDFKEAHKSFIGNHNRKKQASRKKKQGMIPS